MLKFNEFAFNRKIAKDKVSNWSKPILEHILKCTVYKNTTNNLNHWIEEELAEYFEAISDYEVKTSSGKLKLHDYRNLAFFDSGTTVADMKCNLRDFKIHNKKTGKYPDFNLTNELAEELFEKFTNVAIQVSEMLAENKKYEAKDFFIVLHSILDN